MHNTKTQLHEVNLTKQFIQNKCLNLKQIVQSKMYEPNYTKQISQKQIQYCTMQIPQSKMHEAIAQIRFYEEYCTKEITQSKLHQVNYIKQNTQTAKSMLHNANHNRPRA